MKLVSTFILCLFINGITANAQVQPQNWMGRRVITHRGTVLAIGDKVVDDEKRTANLKASGQERYVLRVYLVEGAEGKWLWLRDQNSGIAGWVDRERVVPIENGVDFFSQQIKIKPEAELYNSRASVRLALKDLDNALIDFNEAIRLDPHEALYYCNRGAVFHEKNEYERAIADYDHAIKLDPRLAWAYANRGSIQTQKNEFDKAIADFTEAIHLDPEDAGFYTNRGNAWDGKKDYDRAIADFDQAIRIDPELVLAYFNRGNSRSRKEEYQKANEDYDRAVQLDPKFWPALQCRALNFQKLKRFDDAVADYNKLIKNDSKDYSTYSNLAWICATCPDRKYRNGKRAVSLAIRACEMTKWDDPSIMSVLAAAYAESGEFEKAVPLQEKVVALSPDSEKKKQQVLLDLFRSKKAYRPN